MNKTTLLIGLLFASLSHDMLASNINLHNGDLLSTDTIDVELYTQTGNCPTQFPVQSVDCTYSSLSMKGLIATYIDKFSGEHALTTANTYLLNIAVNGVPIASCQSLQNKIVGYSLITINKSGCVIT